ncbi:MAG TPA: VCBS repeat-containing protein, partial [Acidobacteriaceae bacterium]
MLFRKNGDRPWTRRAVLKSLGSTSLLLAPGPLYGSPLLSAPFSRPGGRAFDFADAHLTPRYPARSPLQDVLRLVAPGSDEYRTERHAFEIEAVLRSWAAHFKAGEPGRIAESLDPSCIAASLVPARKTQLRAGSGIEIVRREFSPAARLRGAAFVAELAGWLGKNSRVETAEFEIPSIREVAAQELAAQELAGQVTAGKRLTVQAEVRYSLVSSLENDRRQHRVGTWQMEWSRAGDAEAWRVSRWQHGVETLSTTHGPMFVDVTEHALGGAPSYQAQLLRGADHWRTVLDGACGIDVYGNNGVAAGDFDNDGRDDLYVCQPAGLPNRLYRNLGDGRFEDVTEKAGVGVLDNTACALFADFRNVGLQDLLVTCGTGPLLFLNQGDGSFRLKRDAFQFAHPPLGTFTHAAVADYDRDGRLDIYFCLYSYYLGLDQYHYPVPYFDARNGPPNFLLHNQGDATFVDRTEAAGLSADNDRYSFAAAWGESASNNLPDLYVANDFGRNTFYRNRGDGTFQSEASRAHVEDVGAGMSAAWSDVNQDGHPDIYVANMWSAAGQRVSQQQGFHAQATPEIRSAYQRHARGNALYRNRGDGTFENASEQAGVAMGRWAWCSDFWDFDHDGHDDLYVANGYISAGDRGEAGADELGSFFWRQVVGRSPDDTTPSLAYEHGWNALNELIRSDKSWSGHERNVLYCNHGDGTFSEISGAAGLDFPEDARSFALADLDGDGRLEVILKNRNAPQVRVLHNATR